MDESRRIIAEAEAEARPGPRRRRRVRGGRAGRASRPRSPGRCTASSAGSPPSTSAAPRTPCPRSRSPAEGHAYAPGPRGRARRPGAGGASGRTAMTVHDPSRHHPVDAHGDPLTFAVSGLLAELPGTVREYELDEVEVDPGEGLVATEPVGGTLRLSRTNRGLVVDARLRTALAGECARCLRPLVTPISGPDRRGGPAGDRLRQRHAGGARGGRGSRDAAPHRPSRAGAPAAGPRGHQPPGADRAAVRAGLPRPVPRVRRAARGRSSRSRGRRSTRASRRSGRSGSTARAETG